jgi:hypothetical protein
MIPMKSIFFVLAFSTGVAAAQLTPSMSDVVELRNALAGRFGGVVVRQNGIDTLAAMEALSEAVLELDARVRALEAEKAGRHP